MSQERVIKTLNQFGLSKMDAEIYILLAKSGPQNEWDIVKTLKITKKSLISSVKNLCNKGIVVTSTHNPMILCAFPFEKALERLIKIEIENAKEIRKIRDESFSYCFSIDLKNRKEKKP